MALTRRRFLEVSSLALAGSTLAGRLGVGQDGVRPAGTADACILIKLIGAPSHVDTFDLKVGPWTPPNFDVVNCGSFELSRRLFPNLCRLAPGISLVRSGRAWGVEHSQALYALVAGRQFNPGFVQEIPHLGSVVSLEASERGQTGPFPPFITFNTSSEIDAGFLAESYGSRHNPFLTFPYAPEISHPLGPDRFNRRWELLKVLDRSLRRIDNPRGATLNIYDGLYGQARELTGYRPFEAAFEISDAERRRYGASLLGDACVVARKLVAAGGGTRFIVINHSGDEAPQAWDTHADIYAANNLPALTRELDAGLGALIDDLKATQTPAGSATLFDRTLIVVAGEFGRTVGALNITAGRDHFPVFSVLFAGGGVRGNRVIGATDATGERIVDSGWRDRVRPTRVEDIAASIYSALGINWTRTILGTPSGRAFSLTAYSPDGEHGPIPLFD